jgi:hypothetical protein
MVGRSLRQIVWARLRRDKVAMVCLVILIVMYLIAIVDLVRDQGNDDRGPDRHRSLQAEQGSDQRRRRAAEGRERRNQLGSHLRG